MRIVLVVHQFPPLYVTGTELYALRVGRALLQQGHEVHVFSGSPSHMSEVPTLLSWSEPYEEVPVDRLEVSPALFPNRSLSEYYAPIAGRMFGALLDRVRPDVVHVHHLMYLGASLLEEAWIRKIPTVMVLADFWALCPRVTLYDMNRQVCPGPERVSRCDECFTSWRVRGPTAVAPIAPKGADSFGDGGVDALGREGPLLEWQAASVRPAFLREMLRLPEILLAPSECLRETYVRHGYDPEHLQPMRYGIDENLVRRERKGDGKVLRFGFVGSIQPHKGAALLVEAFRGLEWPEATLSIHGDLGTDVVHGKMLRELAAPDARVRLCGRFERRDLARVLDSLDVLVVPSVWPENTPFVALEAQGAGIPVLASKVDGLAEAIRPGVDGLLFDRGSVEDMRLQLQAFQKDPDLLNRMSREAPRGRPMPDHVRDMVKIWEKAIESRRRPEREDSASAAQMKARHRRMLAEQIDWLVTRLERQPWVRREFIRYLRREIPNIEESPLTVPMLFQLAAHTVGAGQFLHERIGYLENRGLVFRPMHGVRKTWDKFSKKLKNKR
ncbi:MAG: glycosyltransferase family 4 protein [Planctomycetota bacterium]